jgi:hypothetical protein
MKRYQTLTTEREAGAQLTHYDEHRPGLPMLRRIQGRWRLDAFGRYWPPLQSRRWLRRLWQWLAKR